MKIYHKYFSKYSNIIVIKIIKKNLKSEQSQGYGFSDSVMCRCESWMVESAECLTWCFWIVVLEKLVGILWTTRRSIQLMLGKISPSFSLEGLMLKLGFRFFGHLMKIAKLLGKSLMLGKNEGRRRRWQRMN